MSHLYPDKNPPIHEAGHGLVAKRLGGGRVRLRAYATARFDNPGMFPRGLNGFCEHDELPGATGLERLRAYLTVLVAGPAAEQIASGRDPLGPAPPHEIFKRMLMLEGRPLPNAYDWALQELEEEFGGDRLRAYLWLDAAGAQILELAVSTLRAEWPAVKRLAELLETQGEVIVP
jgi:hypothetical protein